MCVCVCVLHHIAILGKMHMKCESQWVTKIKRWRKRKEAIVPHVSDTHGDFHLGRLQANIIIVWREHCNAQEQTSLILEQTHFSYALSKEYGLNLSRSFYRYTKLLIRTIRTWTENEQEKDRVIRKRRKEWAKKVWKMCLPCAGNSL